MRLAHRQKMAHMSPITEDDLDVLQREYNSIRTYARHIAEGSLRSLIVSGPPGVGKSAMLRKFLQEFGQTGAHQYLQGKVTPLSLYHALYLHRAPKQVLILDDADSVFKDNDGQNILKNAMDTIAVRQITYASTSALLSRMNLPESFKTEGSVVLVTNVGFSGNTRASVHLAAIKDRSFPLQVGSDNPRTRFAMVVFMVVRQGMLDHHNFTHDERAMLLMFLYENIERIQSLSLRTMVKLAELYKLEPTAWRDIAATGLLMSE